jgi:CMP-N-acetylneuraminic acid synthetase
MTSQPKIIAMISARRGSTRLKQKNLALLNGRPMIAYVIESAKQAGVFDRIVLNSEDIVFKDIAEKYGVEFYQRPGELATSTAKSDDVVHDFITHNPCDIVVWVNSIAPLQPAEEIKEVIEHFQKEKLDSLITVKNEQVHCVSDGKPLNFSLEGKFAQTQDLKPVGFFVYSLMMWRAKTFQQFYKKQGFAMLSGKVGYFPVGKLSAIIVKREEDLRFAEYVLAGQEARKDYTLKYEGTL